MISELEKYQFLLSPDGRAALVGEMAKFRQTHGEKWLEKFKSEFPDFVFFVDLIANHDAENALVKFKQFIFDEIENVDSMLKRIAYREIAAQSFKQMQPALLLLHKDVKAEIDKPRF